MSTTPAPPVRIGALAPLTRPGWTEAGRHLLAGLELAVAETNAGGGIDGRPLELVVRDTAADPRRAEAAVGELAGLGVAALAGEYHSVAARAAAARADALGLPFLCSSAVLDALTERPTDRVARLAPAQSHGWRVYADFLLAAGHGHVAVAAEPSLYWAAGTRILRDHLTPRGGTVTELDAHAHAPAALCDALAGGGVRTSGSARAGESARAGGSVRTSGSARTGGGVRAGGGVRIGGGAPDDGGAASGGGARGGGGARPAGAATALLLLTGFPDPAVPIVRAVRRDPRLAGLLVGAPAGQPEFAAWADLLGGDGAAIPFLRYLPEHPTPLGSRVETALRSRLAAAPSFVAFEGYDTITVLAETLRTHGTDRATVAGSWPRVAVEGTRGPIRFTRPAGTPVQQWAWPPVQVADRDPAAPSRFRTLHTAAAGARV
ncbi:ABC transporter substrate-binding protein [Streptomyces sp. NPDC058052]|uniref:ABC transporter substrate-binding protein n=1 Tax=Streptomyces sp. NPDC058052 TaxID=3346316 RepID=UPI0036EBE8EA